MSLAMCPIYLQVISFLLNLVYVSGCKGLHVSTATQLLSCVTNPPYPCGNFAPGSKVFWYRGSWWGSPWRPVFASLEGLVLWDDKRGNLAMQSRAKCQLPLQNFGAWGTVLQCVPGRAWHGYPGCQSKDSLHAFVRRLYSDKRVCNAFRFFGHTTMFVSD